MPAVRRGGEGTSPGGALGDRSAPAASARRAVGSVAFDRPQRRAVRSLPALREGLRAELGRSVWDLLGAGPTVRIGVRDGLSLKEAGCTFCIRTLKQEGNPRLLADARLTGLTENAILTVYHWTLPVF